MRILVLLSYPVQFFFEFLSSIGLILVDKSFSSTMRKPSWDRWPVLPVITWSSILYSRSRVTQFVRKLYDCFSPIDICFLANARHCSAQCIMANRHRIYHTLECSSFFLALRKNTFVPSGRTFKYFSNSLTWDLDGQLSKFVSIFGSILLCFSPPW